MSSQKIIMFQTGIIKLCMIHKNEGTEELENRIERLEQTLKNGIVPIQNTVTASNKTTQNNVKKAETKEKPEVKQSAKKAEGPIENNWKKVVNDFKSSGKIILYTNLINTNAREINDMTVAIEFPNGITPFGKDVLEKSENINEIEKQVSIICGKEMRVKFVDTKKENVETINAENSIEAFAKNSDIPFNIVDE